MVQKDICLLQSGIFLNSLIVVLSFYSLACSISIRYLCLPIVGCQVDFELVNELIHTYIYHGPALVEC